MNKLLLMAILGSWQISFAQLSTVQLNLKDTTQNLLYLGMKNRIAIKNIAERYTVKFNNLSASATGAYEGRPKNEKIYEIQPDREGSYLLQVFDGSKEVYRKEFTIKALKGGLHFWVGKIRDSVTTVSEILANPYAITELVGSQLKYQYSVHLVHYKMMIVTKEGTIERTKTDNSGLDGKVFDNDIIAVIQKMKKGDKILIDDIHVRNVDGILRVLAGTLTLVIE